MTKIEYKFTNYYKALYFFQLNTFGSKFRISIFGESHGKWIGTTIDGCPAGVALAEGDFLIDINRRKPGLAGTTTRVESDIPMIVSGVYNGKTTGAPLTLVFENNNIQSSAYNTFKEIPRPGHADFVLDKKYKGFNDYRGGGHSSGRLTLALVAAGVIAKKILPHIIITATLIEAGGETDIEVAIQKAISNQDSIGGIVSCTIDGLGIGIGEPFFNSLESLISHAVFSIPAVKGIEFGSGFAAAKMQGSQHNDAIINELGNTSTNHAGGINGGISNGNPIVFRVAVKPTSSTPATQYSWNNTTKGVAPFAIKGRHDLCIALRVPVVVEAVTAMVIADLIL